MFYNIPVPLSTSPAAPWPSDTIENIRWRYTAMARSMLTGLWEEHLRDALVSHFPHERQEALGVPDMSSNVLKSVASQLSTLHDREPTIRHREESASAGLIGDEGSLHKAGWAPLMQRFGIHVIGLRENLLHVAVNTDGTIQLRPVPPDRVTCTATQWAPDVPVEVRELRLRSREPGLDPEWTWDVVSIADPDEPYYRVHSAGDGGELGEDLSPIYLDENYSGAAYPFRRDSGEPVLPYVLYHAAKLGDSLWDPFDLKEVLKGSLTTAVLNSFGLHVAFDASWPQRVAVDIRIQGSSLTSGGEAGARHAIVTDPATILIAESMGDTQPLLHQFKAGADPEAIFRVAQEYARQVAEQYGLSPSDMQRMSGNARSGYAIALTNTAKREAQRRFAPQFRVGDQLLIETCAILSNRAAGTKYPESGYRVEYQAIPLSDQEKEAQTTDIETKMRLGLMSAVDAYEELHPGISREAAFQELERIQKDNARLGLTQVTRPQAA